MRKKNLHLTAIALGQLNKLKREDIDSAVIEEHVADAAQYRDERSGFNTNWCADIDAVTKQICSYFNEPYYDD